MQADRTTLITTGMNFNDKDGAAFWPIYQQYEYERSRLDDGRVAVIKEYTQKYPNLTDAEAKAMADQMLDCDFRLAALKKKYYKKFNKVLPALTVAKFFQLERRVDLMMDMQVESSLPPLTQAQYTGTSEVAWQNRLSNEARCSSTAILIQGALDVQHHEAARDSRGNVNVGSHGTGANAGPERNALGARPPRAGDSHSKPWAYVRGCAGPGANHKRLSEL